MHPSIPTLALIRPCWLAASLSAAGTILLFGDAFYTAPFTFRRKMAEDARLLTADAVFEIEG